MTANLSRLIESERVKRFNRPISPPGPFEDLRRRAKKAFEEGRHDDVLGMVREIPEWEQNDVALHLVGQTLKYKGELPAAREFLLRSLELRKQALSESPSREARLAVSRTLVVLGEVETGVGDADKATRLYAQASALSPDFSLPYINRLCIASRAQDGVMAQAVIDEMQENYTAWREDGLLIDLLESDGSLNWLRFNHHFW